MIDRSYSYNALIQQIVWLIFTTVFTWTVKTIIVFHIYHPQVFVSCFTLFLLILKLSYRSFIKLVFLKFLAVRQMQDTCPKCICQLAVPTLWMYSFLENNVECRTDCHCSLIRDIVHDCWLIVFILVLGLHFVKVKNNVTMLRQIQHQVDLLTRTCARAKFTRLPVMWRVLASYDMENCVCIYIVHESIFAPQEDTRVLLNVVKVRRPAVHVLKNLIYLQCTWCIIRMNKCLQIHMGSYKTMNKFRLVSFLRSYVALRSVWHKRYESPGQFSLIPCTRWYFSCLAGFTPMTSRCMLNKNWYNIMWATLEKQKFTLYRSYSKPQD